MKTYQISKISDAVPSSLGNRVFIISVNGAETIESHKNKDLIGRKATIILSEKWFKQAVKSSRLGTDNLDDAMHLLTGGTITGDITFKRKGSKFTATKFSSAVREKKAKVGDQLVKESDGYVISDVDLLFEANNTRAERFMVAKAKAAANNAASIATEMFATGNDAELVDPDDVNESEGKQASKKAA